MNTKNHVRRIHRPTEFQNNNTKYIPKTKTKRTDEPSCMETFSFFIIFLSIMFALFILAVVVGLSVPTSLIVDITTVP